MTIRQQVLEILTDNPYKHMSVQTIAAQIDENLTERQVRTALHGLKNGLGDDLRLTTVGTWIYTPPAIESRESEVMRVPVGWERRMRVVAKFGPDVYILMPVRDDGTPVGTYLWASPVQSPIEWEESDYEPPIHLP